jgi:F-type H+-transporting ATPase subunit delta
MSAHSKKAALLARQLFKLSLENGVVSAERVAGALVYLEKSRPANPVMVLKVYRRLIATELARSEAAVEHAGSLPPSVLQSLTTSLTAKYQRPITATATANPALIAGLRVRVGDDLYEASVAGQLAALTEAV